MKLHHAICRLGSWTAVALQILLALLFGLLLLDVLWGVFSRYILGTQARWSEEVAIHLLIWVSVFGAALTYRMHGHLGFDYVVKKFDPAAQRWAFRFVQLVVLSFISYVFLSGGMDLVLTSLGRGQVTPALGWQTGWLYMALPASGIAFWIFGLEHLSRSFVEKGENA